MTGTPPRESWQALQQKPANEPTPEQESLADMVMRAVQGGEGKMLLDWMRSETVEKRLSAAASNEELRWMEAQRSLVSRIENLRDQGIANLNKRSKG